MLGLCSRISINRALVLPGKLLFRCRCVATPAETQLQHLLQRGKAEAHYLSSCRGCRAHRLHVSGTNSFIASIQAHSRQHSVRGRRGATPRETPASRSYAHFAVLYAVSPRLNASRTAAATYLAWAKSIAGPTLVWNNSGYVCRRLRFAALQRAQLGRASAPWCGRPSRARGLTRVASCPVPKRQAIEKKNNLNPCMSSWPTLAGRRPLNPAA